MKRLLLLAFLSIALVACREDGRIERATALGALAAAQAEAGDLEASRETVSLALETLRLAGTEGDARALMAVVWAQGKAGDLEDARYTAERIERAEDRALALGRLAALQARGGDRTGATETLALAIEAASWSRGRRIHPELILTRALLGDPSGALAMAEGFGRGEIRVMILTVLAAIQAQAGDLSGMAERLSLAHEAAAVMAAGAAEEDPGLILQNVAAAWLRAIAGDSAGALETASHVTEAAWSLEDRELAGMALFVAAAAQLEAGGQAAAERTMAQLREAAATAGMGGGDLMIASVALLEGRAGDVEAAAETVEEIVDPHFRDAVLVVLAAVRAAAGDATGAREFMTLALESFPEASDREELLTVAARVQLMSGDPSGAGETLDRIAGSPGFCGPLPAAMLGRISAGDFLGAGWEFLDWRPHCDYGGRTGGVEVAVLRARAGRHSEARQGLVLARDSVLNAAEAGDRERLLAWIAGIEAEGRDGGAEGPEPETEAAEPRVSPAYALLLNNRYERARALAAIARSLAAEGRTEAAAETSQSALATALGLSDGTLRALAMAAVAEAQAAFGDLESAKESLVLALAAAETVTAPYYRAAALLTVAEAQAAMGDPAAAGESVASAREAVLRIAAPPS